MKSINEYKVVECSGTPYKIGQQWGEGCKESILHGLENLFNGMAFMYKVSKEKVISKAMKFLPLVQDYDPYLIEILKGKATGAGVGFEEIFTQKCGHELLFYYTNMAGYCTSFALTGEATRGGKTLLGQNFDWVPGTPIDLVKIYHSDGLTQLIMSIANSAEITLTSAGFGMCLNATISQDYAFNFPSACYMPKVMRQKNIYDAVDILKEAAGGACYHVLADAKGEMFGIESISNDYEILYPNKNMILHTNHYLTERFKKGDTAPTFIPNSYPRLERINTLMNQHYGRINPEIIMEIMADHANRPNSLCQHVDPAGQVPIASIMSFIMVPEEGTIYIAWGNPCEYEFVRYEI
ncbi:MAG: C45 family autoproteolytic acyltransferase/hydrolase [Syntrophomonas sp.]|nr:C45 family autoproteolytic acyltransferase/hydrolase [Syntrophomonas sp.]